MASRLLRAPPPPTVAQSFSTPSAAPISRRHELRANVLARPDDLKALLRLAKFEAEVGELDNFVSFAGELCRQSPCAWHGVCRLLNQRLGRCHDAVSILEELHDLEPTNAEICSYLAKLLTVRSLYHLGETLVLSGNGVEGRKQLVSLLDGNNDAYRIQAAALIATSFAMECAHTEALKCCQYVEKLDKKMAHNCPHELRVARVVQGITHFRTGDLPACIESLSSVGSLPRSSGPESTLKSWDWEAMTWPILVTAEALQGNFAVAERYSMQAMQACEAQSNAGLMESAAFLRQAQGDLVGAEALLETCLEADDSSPLALLRMGYLLLCRRHFDRAIQFFQKCVRQPSRTLLFGPAEKGVAHLYLCVAYHLRRQGAEAATSADPLHPGESSQDEKLSRRHFHSALRLRPELQMDLASVVGRGVPHVSGWDYVHLARRLIAESPSRWGVIDLNVEQAAVVLLHYSASGLHALLSGGAPVATPQFSPNVAAKLAPAQQQLTPRSYEEQCSMVGTASTTLPQSSSASREATPARCAPCMSSSIAGLTQSSSSSRQASTPPVSTAGTACCPSDSIEADGVFTARSAVQRRLAPSQVLRAEDLQFDECMASGEFAVVHRGALRSLPGCPVALKVPSRRACAQRDGAAISDLLSEIAIHSELRHPRLVAFVGACLEPESMALVTELALGGNLHQALHVKRFAISWHVRIQMAKELLEALVYLHSRRPAIAHLDVKSMNVVLDAEGQHVQLCDFGLARALLGPADEGLERVGGSPRYMAPECHDATLGIVTELADVFSAGCILLELFGNELPYSECSNAQQILTTVLVRRSGPTVPECITGALRDDVVSFALTFEPTERPAAATVLQRLVSYEASC